MVAKHVFFGLGLLPWFFGLMVVFMAFGGPGLQHNPFTYVALISYVSYPILYIVGLFGSIVLASISPASRWSARLALLPLLSPACFVPSYVIVAATS